jgi:hypothetical protein
MSTWKCDGYGVKECDANVGESGLWELQDGSVVTLCKGCESDSRAEGVVLAPIEG